MLVYLRDGPDQKIVCVGHTEIEVADQTCYVTQSWYIDTALTNPSADPTTPCAWQGSHWSTNLSVISDGNRDIPGHDVKSSLCFGFM